MIKNVMLILKYSYLDKVRKSRKKKVLKGKKNEAIMGILLQFLLPAIVFSIALFPIFQELPKQLSIPLSEFGLNYDWNTLDIFLGYSLFMMTILFIFNYSTGMVANLFESEINLLLLSMPFKRSEIFLASSIDSLVMSGIPFAMMLPITIFYPTKNIFFTLLNVLALLVFIFLLISISNLIGALISLFVSKTGAKRLNLLAYFSGIIFFVYYTNAIAGIIKKLKIPTLDYLDKMISFSLSPYSPHTWYLKILKGEYWIVLPLIILSTALIFLMGVIVRNLELGISRGKRKKKKITLKSSAFPFFTKDIKFLMRESQALFLLLYPMLLPFIFLFTGSQGNNSTFGIHLAFIMIASFYATIVTVLLLSYELSVWPIPKSFPISMKRMVMFKAILVSSMYIVELIGVLLVFFILKRIKIIDFTMVIPTFLLLIYSAFIGVNMFLKNPKRSVLQRFNLSVKETLIIEGATIGPAIFIAMFGLPYLYHLIYGVPFFIKSKFWIFIMGIVAPLGSLAVIIAFIVFFLKKFPEMLENLE